ncbi:MAG TPA: adventurous gliding motility lipoprotein CglC [Anaeromyxobacteraceae bacterium]|nr:adventurous gliding motility lipoprotein CglC [Anaeromyxobacteraceae bacterium]
MRFSRLAIVAACAALLSGCQPPDVGQRCELAWGTDRSTAPTPTSTESDYVETGNASCETLVCIVSKATSGEYSTCDGDKCGYCSKPCVSDADCYKSETGLVCRKMVLDDAFIASLDPATREKYHVQYSSYCAVPLEQ